MLKSFMEYAKKSVLDNTGKVSHTKISSYIILLGINLSSLIFLIIDVINACISWSNGIVYEIPASHLGIFGMLLTHHLALLGIKKYSENKYTKVHSKDIE